MQPPQALPSIAPHALPASRPLRAWDERAIRTEFERALVAGEGLPGAHCIHELWMRAALGFDVDAALERLWRRAARSVPEWLPMRYVEWLPTAYEVAGRFHASDRGRCNVYLILLDYADRGAGGLGVYVGMTSHAPELRFDQHKAGIHAAGSVLRRGLELLCGPTLHLQRIPRAAALRIECGLAAALADAGLVVRGGH
jgi:hypothetical protein